jgi:hypothetical protein
MYRFGCLSFYTHSQIFMHPHGAWLVWLAWLSVFLKTFRNKKKENEYFIILPPYFLKR